MTGLFWTWLVIGDIETFDTNIDTETIDHSMEAVMSESRTQIKIVIAIGQLVQIVTHKTLVAVDGTLDRQTYRLAMSSMCTGTVANLSLARREKKFNVSRERILTYTQYIHDIFTPL